jgi:hypothetical protein
MLFVLFLFAIILSVILRFRDCDYPFGIFKVFFCTIYVCLSTLSINDDNRDYCMEGVNLSSLEHMGDHIVPYFVTLFWFTYFTYVFCLPESFLFFTVSPGYLTYYFYSTNKTFTLIYMHHLFFSNTWSTKVTESCGVLIQTLGPSISIWIITDGVELSMLSSIHIFFVEVVLTFKYKHWVLICKHFWYQLQWPKDNIFASN